MKEETREITIDKNKVKVDIQIFEKKDAKKLKTLYKLWIPLNKGMKLFKARGINLPEGISESAFCIHFNGKYARALKVSKGHGSFDVINLKTCETIQIKASSVEEDLTSFGPRSIWDKLYFLDFHRQDGTFDVYLIPNKKIYSQKTSKNQTFRDMQKQGKRPRFSIKKEIIIKNKIKPLKTCKL
ncbi:MAG: Bsp6I family type II restriction endonuclease [Candidatus Diapherotrites archaeon]|jgi:hypothetical protein|nr:Bsp6I family type II restriction endonuclease [Candidatus Diapherotrites archaeon]MBT4596875.1 Bsp6I family type II restriction endonuclease [Candidatus Diapherotrites archaeon]